MDSIWPEKCFASKRSWFVVVDSERVSVAVSCKLRCGLVFKFDFEIEFGFEFDLA